MLYASVLQGASILLMLSTSLLGEQQFKKGLIQYLNQYKGLNTNTEDLWNSLTQVTAAQFLQECLFYVSACSCKDFCSTMQNYRVI